jgi:hypothetical protein
MTRGGGVEEGSGRVSVDSLLVVVRDLHWTSQNRRHDCQEPEV